MTEPWNFTEAQRRQFREAHADAKRTHVPDPDDPSRTVCGQPADTTAAEDREFEARTILNRHGVQLEQFRPFTLEQIESLAEVVKTWED